MEKHKISRRNALRMMGAMCAGTVLSSCTGTKVKAEEPTETEEPTEKPTETEEPTAKTTEKPADKTTKAPKTGDNTNIWLYVTLMMLSALTGSGYAVRRRRKNRKAR